MSHPSALTNFNLDGSFVLTKRNPDFIPFWEACELEQQRSLSKYWLCSLIL